jgi:hypothetical protein
MAKRGDSDGRADREAEQTFAMEQTRITYGIGGQVVDTQRTVDVIKAKVLIGGGEQVLRVPVPTIIGGGSQRIMGLAANPRPSEGAK